MPLYVENVVAKRHPYVPVFYVFFFEASKNAM
jgi:hypothetical protein